MVFNPRLREGGDDATAIAVIFFGVFNPRLREGGDFYYAGNNVFTKLFNPRLREGGDNLVFRYAIVCVIFNPRLREGGDQQQQPRKKLLKNFQSTPPRRRRPQHIVIPQLSCAYLVSTTFLSTIFSFISQYIVLFPLFRVRMPCVFCVAYDSHYVPLFNIFYILFQGTPF